MKYKKTLILFIIFIISITFVNAIENPDDSSSIDLISQSNPFKSLLDRMDSIIQIMDDILIKVGIIADKNTTVVLDPNITLDLPEKDCEWEKYTQTIDENDFIGNQWNFRNIRITTPESQLYTEINITNVTAFLYHDSTISNINYLVNNVLCYSNLGDFTEFVEPFCPQTFKGGINNLKITGGNGRYLGLLIEMQIKPENC